MDSCLTQKIPITLPPWRKYSGAPKIPGYTHVTSLTPILETFFDTMPESEGQLHSDNLFGRLHEFEGSGTCVVETVGSRKKKTAFCKVIHLLNPVRTLQAYYSDIEKGEGRRNAKLKNPMNQAYVDSMACYLLGQLRERNISPHFCLFYGAFQACADSYRYNITQEFESYRRYSVFWERRRAGLFSLVLEKSDDSEEEGEGEKEEKDSGEHDWILQTPKSSLRSSGFEYTTPRSSGSRVTDKDEVLSVGDHDVGPALELQSVDSLPSAEEDSKENEDSEEESEETEEESLSVYVELQNYPVMLMFQEQMEGVLDDLLEDDGELVGAEPNTPEWEARWTAWTFQVIAALCAAQGVYGMTHNDLHTNNIVWKETDQSWIWYKSRDGTVFRVPTFGKIFCIIDFGRSIFRVQDKWFVSDDYERGGDAEGQYRGFHGTLRTADDTLKNKNHEVYPNPSFDLCRYAVSVLEPLYPEQPIEKLDGAVLSQEGDWKVLETESPFWNLIWSWLIDDHGRNVLREADGEERFPDFDLYIHIAEHVHGVKPQDQIHRDIFKSYLIDPKDVGDWETVYPLFC